MPLPTLCPAKHVDSALLKMLLQTTHRSGYTTFLHFVTANRLVFDWVDDFADILCFQGQFNGGDLLGLSVLHRQFFCR